MTTAATLKKAINGNSLQSATTWLIQHSGLNLQLQQNFGWGGMWKVEGHNEIAYVTVQLAGLDADKAEAAILYHESNTAGPLVITHKLCWQLLKHHNDDNPEIQAMATRLTQAEFDALETKEQRWYEKLQPWS